MWRPTGDLADLIAQQDGVVSRTQLLTAGLSPAQAVQHVRTGRWLRLFPGVYATFTGPVPDRARVHAALLAVGGDAVAGFWTALWVVGLVKQVPDLIHVCVPWPAKRVALPGVEVVQRRGLEELVQRSRPPRTRVEVSVLDVADRARSPDRVIGPVLEAVQRRFTSAERLQRELARRSRHRWRGLLREVLAEAEDGVASSLERRYLVDVERRHGLPSGIRNSARTDPEGRRRYDDVRYPGQDVVVELDGRAAHPVAEAFRDWRRDNLSAVEGRPVLRYGWPDVASSPCHVARQVATVLTARGWTGRLRGCKRCPPP